MPMIDLHSHILPNLDDGSKDADESIALLNLLANQGIETVVATPHFYANDESVENFLKRRTESYEILSQRLYDGLPKIFLGAEVRYYQGISRMPDINKLCIDGTNHLKQSILAVKMFCFFLMIKHIFYDRFVCERTAWLCIFYK